MMLGTTNIKLVGRLSGIRTQTTTWPLYPRN